MPVWREKEPCVYIMASRPNGVLYAGVTSNLRERVLLHKQGAYGGFTKRHKIHDLVYYEMHASMDDAIRRESQLKKWQRAWKVRLIKQMNPEWLDLFLMPELELLDGPADRTRCYR